MMDRFVLTSRWRVAAAPTAVWALLTEVEAWPRWWRYVRHARIVSRSASSPVGDVTTITWASALPYGVKLRVATTACQRPRLLKGHADGDLRGVGTWLIEPADDDGSDVTYRWEVVLERAWMRRFAWLLRPLFEWNHFVVMRAGAHGMAQALGGTQATQLQEWTGQARP